MLRWLPLGLVLLVASCGPPPATSGNPTPAVASSGPGAGGVSLAKARPIDEGLRAEYGRCDAADTFMGVRFPITDAAGKTVYYKCSSDPSRLDTLVKLDATPSSRAAVVYTSKLGLDLDGSWIACNKHGPTDQCTTSIMMPADQGEACVYPRAPRVRCMPVDSDKIAYVVLPASAPRGLDPSGFKRATGVGVGVGDLGVVVFNGRVVPVVVADSGPVYKIGEGSMALHRALGTEFCSARDCAGNCTAAKQGGSIGNGVTTILFPGSAPSGLNPRGIADVVGTQGKAMYDKLAAAYPD